jgi:uncharacterized protein YbjQ (UPF0145 family)
MPRGFTARESGAWTSDLSVAEFDVLGSVGFRPVGQVLGVSVYQIGYSGSWCGRFYAGDGSVAKPAGPRVQSLYDARRKALRRLTAEAKALGADGVVGVDLTIRPFPDVPQATEFGVIGTAVRADGKVHATEPFLSDLSGQDFVKLLRAGWVPTGIAMGVAVLIRHNDQVTAQQAMSWSNTELSGYTQLVQATRDACREALSADVRRQGGEGVVVRDMTLRVHERECSAPLTGRGDQVAEATMLGTAITRFTKTKAHDGPGTLPILRVGAARSTGGTA